MLSGRKITVTLIGEMLEGSVAKGHPQRGIFLPLMCSLVADVVAVVLDVIQWGTHYTNQQKIPNYCPTGSSGGLCMEQQWCDRNQPSIYPENFQHWDQHFMKAGHLDKIC